MLQNTRKTQSKKKIGTKWVKRLLKALQISIGFSTMSRQVNEYSRIFFCKVKSHSLFLLDAKVFVKLYYKLRFNLSTHNKMNG